MKTNTKTSALAGALVAAALLAAPAAAGYKSSYFVTVDQSMRMARGNVGDVHNTSDGTQYIYCHVGASPGTVAMSCSARTVTGVSSYCYSYEPALVTAAQAIGGDSSIQVYWNASGFCTTLYVTNGSTSDAKNTEQTVKY